MKITFDWLLEHLDRSIDLDQSLQYLTQVGLEVEDVQQEHFCELKDFIIAKIVSVRPHPNADRLRLCTVDISGTDETEKYVEVVCGAPNVKPDMGVVYAPINTYIPGSEFTLIPKSIRGIVSEGMLCSGKELQLSKETDGIIEFNTKDSSLPKPFHEYIGKSLQEYLGGLNPVIEFKVTPNRGDLLGVLGIAREIIAGGFANWASQQNNEQHKHDTSFHNDLTFDRSQASWCYGITSFVTTFKHHIQTPQKIYNRLMAIGITPKYFAVDMSNYLMIDQNRPSHMFDLDTIVGSKISLTNTKQAVEFEDLLGEIHILPKGTPVMEDEEGIVSIPGIIGGKRTAISYKTQNILVELALFDPLMIAKTGRSLNIMSDARYRFERGLDPSSLYDGFTIIAEFIQNYSKGVVYKPHYDTDFINSKGVMFFPEDVQSIGGIHMKDEEIKSILIHQGYKILHQKDKNWELSPPLYRQNIESSLDIVFDVLRIVGLDRIAPKPLEIPIQPNTLEKKSWINYTNYPTNDEQQLSNALASMGYDEVISWSFMDDALLDIQDHSLILENPIAKNLNSLRPSVLYNLIEFANKNLKASIGGGKIFELGQNYSADSEELVCTVLQFGIKQDAFWRDQMETHTQNDPAVNMYDIKADLEKLLSLYGISIFGRNKIHTEVLQSPLYHPGRSLKVIFQDNIIATFGQIHPIIQSKFASKSNPMIGFEFYYEQLDTLLTLSKEQDSTEKHVFYDQRNAIPSLQRQQKDMAFYIPKDISIEKVLQAMEVPFLKTDTLMLKSIQPFDIFQPKDKKDFHSVAFRMTWYPMHHTPTMRDIEELFNQIVESVQMISPSIQLRDH